MEDAAKIKGEGGRKNHKDTKKSKRWIKALPQSLYGHKIDPSMVTEKDRLALRQCEAVPLADGRHKIVVLLQSQETDYKIESECSCDTESQLLSRIAQAVLDALGPALNKQITFRVMDLQLWNLGEPPQPFITILVEVDFGKKQMSLPGICNVGDSKYLSAGKAALDAINRIIDLYLK